MSELIYHNKTLTYTSYLKVNELLGMQTVLSDPQHHDELLFIVSHQVYELWFKQIIHELQEICRLLDADEPAPATQYFERIHRIQHLLIEQLPVLETMFASDFAQFRDHLRPASGFQSVQFRKIEFLCGAKNQKMVELAGDNDPIRTELNAAMQAPTIYDHLLRHLARSGIAVPKSILERDVSQVHQPSEELSTAFIEIYRDPYKNYARFRLCEHFLEFEERFSLWRFHHVKMVERMIGSKGGTGGSSGARYLMSTVSIQFFPELWMVRSHIGGSYGEANNQPHIPGSGCPMGH